MFISSDTNIWIDFFEINHPDHPFLLEKQGLLMTDLSDAEMKLAEEYSKKYKRLSVYDTFALAIAKKRSWTLLTGDQPLRKAAAYESVECHGLIWIYDELHRLSKLSNENLREALQALIESVQEGRSRLPIEELKKRLNNLDNL